MKTKKSFFLIFFLFFLFSFSVSTQSTNIVTVEIDGTINQSTVEIVKESIDFAKSKNSQAIILLLDTPGGGLEQTFEIASLINKSSIPVVGYVYPSGSAAWSAGTFILLSTHIAAMANYTVIGSAQPVEISVTGSRLINDSKTINALTEWIETRADMFNRNKTIARKFITENLNLNETKALEYNVIEYISPSIKKLIHDINGTKVITDAGEKILDTRNAKQIKYTPSIGIQFMKFFSNPILTSTLFIIGIFAIIFGISAPGLGAEVFGGIAVLLSLVGSGFSIPVLSIIFIIVGCLLFIVEIFVTPGFGVIGIGGLISLVIGSLFLIPNYPNREWLITMSWLDTAMIVVLTVVAIIGAFFIFLLYKIIQSYKRKKAMGVFVGEKARTIDQITPSKGGYVRFKGELWNAISDKVIPSDTEVLIIEKKGSTLKVKSLKG